MIDNGLTTFFQYNEYPIKQDASANSIVEGSPLVITTDNGVGKVSLGTGSDSEKFLGVAFAGLVRPTVLPFQESFAVPTALTYVLQKQALSLPLVYIDGVVATVATTAPTATDEVQYTIATNTLTFYTGTTGNVIVVYKYTASLVEARAATGDGYPGGLELNELNGTIGVIKQGTVATDQFDLTVDWSASNTGTIKVNSAGLFSIGGTGATVSNGYVVQAPGFGSPFLVIGLK
jgi:hypothetical protein